MLSINEFTAVASLRLLQMSYEEDRKDFVRKFKKPVPSRQAIPDLVNKFQRTGNVADVECSGMPPTAQDTIEDAIQRSPTTSIRRLSREFGVALTTIRRTLHYNCRNAHTTSSPCTILKLMILQLARQCGLTYWN